LGVCIDEERAFSHEGKSCSHVESGRCLPYSTFLVGDGNDQITSSKDSTDWYLIANHLKYQGKFRNHIVGMPTSVLMR
jgi:hypothetical protein